MLVTVSAKETLKSELETCDSKQFQSSDKPGEIWKIQWRQLEDSLFLLEFELCQCKTE